MPENSELKNLCKNIAVLMQKDGAADEKTLQSIGLSCTDLQQIQDGILPAHMGAETRFRIARRFKIPVCALFNGKP